MAPRDQPSLQRLLSELGLPQRACRDLSALTLRRELVKGALLGRARTGAEGSLPAMLSVHTVRQAAAQTRHAHPTALRAQRSWRTRSAPCAQLRTAASAAAPLSTAAPPRVRAAAQLWQPRRRGICVCCRCRKRRCCRASGTAATLPRRSCERLAARDAGAHGPPSRWAPAVRVLRELGQLLVDVNGQHAALSLKDSAARVSQAAGHAAALTTPVDCTPACALHAMPRGMWWELVAHSASQASPYYKHWCSWE